MAYLSLPPLVAAAVIFALGIVVYWARGRTETGKVFTFLATTLVIWNLNFFVLYSVLDRSIVFEVTRFLRVGSIFVAPAVLHLAFTLRRGCSRAWRKILWIAYTAACVLTVANVFDLMVVGLRRYAWGYYWVGGPLYGMFAFFLVADSLAAFAILLQAYRETTEPATRLQLKVWLFGLTVALLLGPTNFLPAYGIPFYPLGNLGSVAWAGVTAYAIVRHRLMDIDVFIMRAAAMLVASAAVVLPVAGAVIWLQQLPVGISSALVAGCVLLATAPILLVFSRFRSYLEREVESALFHSRYAAREAIRQLSAELVKLPRHADFSERFTDTLREGLKLVGVALYLKQESHTYQLAYACGSIAAPKLLDQRPYNVAGAAHITDIQWHPTIPHEASDTEDGKPLGPWEACVPLCVDGAELGFMALGTKRSGAAIDGFDAELLSLVAAQLAIGLKNAEYVGKIQRQQAQIDELRQRLEAENVVLRSEVRAASQFSDIIGSSGALQRVLTLVATVAPTDVPVLITGETGTGKELIARAVHDLSPRRGGPLISVNCPAIPPELAESELFGHERGAFTGAADARPGRFELADGGTIFLDEVADLPMAVQVKLLRVLQEHETQRLGGRKVRKLDLRVVAATNRDLHAEMRAQRFREDLYYRLAGVLVPLPPLRERIDDIAMLASYFLDRAAATYQRAIKGFTPEAMDALRRYSWPGNIRELQNLVERAVLLCTSEVIRPEHLSDLAVASTQPVPFGRTIREEKKRRIEQALAQTGGNQAAAARLLGISPSNLARLMKSLGTKRPALQ